MREKNIFSGGASPSPTARSRCLHKIRRDRRPRRSAKKQLPFPSFRDIRDVSTKPPSEREVARHSRDGRSLRDFGVLISFIVTRSPSVSFADSSLPEGALFSGHSHQEKPTWAVTQGSLTRGSLTRGSLIAIKKGDFLLWKSPLVVWLFYLLVQTPVSVNSYHTPPIVLD